MSAAVTIISRQNKNSEYFLFLFRSRRRNVLSDTVHVCLQRLQTSPRLLPSLVQNKTNTRGTKSRRHWKKVNNKTHKFRLSLSPSLLLSLSRNGMSSGERKKKTAFLSLVYLSTPLPSFPFLRSSSSQTCHGLFRLVCLCVLVKYTHTHTHKARQDKTRQDRRRDGI